MSDESDSSAVPISEVYARALDARDPRFDGVFFVGITTTRIYCRPTCPARVSYPDRRRFFHSAAAAERAGYRPCLRCRPELAPGRAPVDAISRLAVLATRRIAAGALNGRSVADLARDLRVSERHLRRALEREVGVGPLELALTHRLLLAKRLLVDARLSVTQIAFTSGFQSLRRFNAAFRERYRMSPSELRRPGTRGARGDAGDPCELVRLTLAYRPPLAWDEMLDILRRDAVPGVDQVDGDGYVRTVHVDGHTGTVAVRPISLRARGRGRTRHELSVELSPGLLPVLMPLLSRLRQLFDLDAEPSVIDAQLARGGMGELVRRRPGVRVPGAVDGFEVALRVLLRRDARSAPAGSDLAWRVTHALGDPIDVGGGGLDRLTPEPSRIAERGTAALVALGVSDRCATTIVGLATAMTRGETRLEPGADPWSTTRQLCAVGVDESAATQILMRATAWPDAFPVHDAGVLHAAGVGEPSTLRQLAERWRPWRSYAAVHLGFLDSNAADDAAASLAG